MKDLRRKMDDIDTQILELIAERLRTAELIGGIKSSKGIEIVDDARESEVVARYRDFASANSLDPDFTENVCRILIDESRKIQIRNKEK